MTPGHAVAARVAPMAADDPAAWRAAREAAGTPLPEGADGDGWEALTVEVDGVERGGAVLTYRDETRSRRASIRLLETTLPDDADAVWAAVLTAVEVHALANGATTLTTAVPPGRAGAFQGAGFQATMTTVSKRLDPDGSAELQEDRRVTLRPMEAAERRAFAEEVRAFLRHGMTRSGVLLDPDSPLGELEARVTRLAGDDPPAEELLVTALVDDVPVGRAWATLVETDGALDFLGNTLDLFPEHRGQGLTRSFLGALVRHVRDLGVRDVHLRVYGFDAGARRTFLDAGAGISEVHLRKDLT